MSEYKDMPCPDCKEPDTFFAKIYMRYGKMMHEIWKCNHCCHEILDKKWEVKDEGS